MMRGRVLRWTVTASAVLLLAGGPVRTEVGVSVDDQLRPVSGIYQILAITEDPNPFGPGAWIRYSIPINSSRAVLNEEGAANGDGPPSTLTNPVGDLPTVAWAKNSAFGFDVVVSTYAEGAWSEPQAVAAGPENELDPSLVVDPATGDVHLFYWVDAIVPVVMHRQAPADLSSWSAPVQVSNGTQPAYRPWGVIHDGTVRVVYEVHPFGAGQTPKQILLSRKEAGGFVQEIVSVSHHDDDLWPRAHSHSGWLWIEWIHDDDEVAWVRLDLQEVWEPARYEAYASPANREFHVRPGIRLEAVQIP